MLENSKRTKRQNDWKETRARKQNIAALSIEDQKKLMEQLQILKTQNATSFDEENSNLLEEKPFKSILKKSNSQPSNKNVSFSPFSPETKIFIDDTSSQDNSCDSEEDYAFQD